jgi:FixJ family two-component response regulator
MNKIATKRPTPSDASAAVPVATVEKVLGVTLGVARDRYARLTRREVQVANLMASGKPNRQIAEELGISPKTLDIHRANVMHKLLVRTTAQIANLVNLLRVVGESEALAS